MRSVGATHYSARMHIGAVRGGGESVSIDVASPKEEVERCLASIGPSLLSASMAADGPDPASAALYLCRAARLLLIGAERLN